MSNCTWMHTKNRKMKDIQRVERKAKQLMIIALECFQRRVNIYTKWGYF